jgi:hypothetical protein
LCGLAGLVGWRFPPVDMTTPLHGLKSVQGVGGAMVAVVAGSDHARKAEAIP